MEFTKKQLEELDPPKYLSLADARRLVDMLNRGETVYGVYRNGAKAGTIGIIKDLKFIVDAYGEPAFNHTFELHIEGREPRTVWGSEVGVLFDYQGPTVWKFKRVKGGANWVPIIDKTGEEIEVGDLVFACEGNRMYYGKVERRSPVGSVWIKELTSNPEDRKNRDNEAVRCGPLRNSQIVKVDGELLGRLMLARLAG